MNTDSIVKAYAEMEADAVKSVEDRLGPMTFKNFDPETFSSMLTKGEMPEGFVVDDENTKYGIVKFNPSCPVIVRLIGDPFTVEDVVDNVVGHYENVRVISCEVVPSTTDFDSYCRVKFAVA